MSDILPKKNYCRAGFCNAHVHEHCKYFKRKRSHVCAWKIPYGVDRCTNVDASKEDMNDFLDILAEMKIEEL